MKWLNRIKVGGDEWAIRLVSWRTLDKSGKVLGDSNTRLRRIRVAKELTERERWSVLLHELTHVALDVPNETGEVGVDLGHLDEFIVERIEKHLGPILEQYGWGK